MKHFPKTDREESLHSDTFYAYALPQLALKDFAGERIKPEV